MSKSMSKNTCRALALVAVPALIATAWGLTTIGRVCVAGESGPEAARCDIYAAPGGTTYFALTLPPTAAPAAKSHDMVILFDTSAGQAGAARDKALELLGSLLQTAGDNDRVQLMAVDLNAISLTKGFVSPRGAEMDAAMKQLRGRTPLGATDMGIALAKATSCFEGQPANGRSVIYIGDGSSKANVVLSEYNGVVDKMVAEHISATSYAIGRPIDATLLAALANQTGGMLMVDSDTIMGKEAGQYLLQKAEGAVLWPSSTEISKSVAEVLPSHTPPLRADRETILLGKLSGMNPIDVKVSGEADGKPISVAWSVKPQKADAENSYIEQLVNAGHGDGGYRLPTVGSEGLAESRRLVQSGAQSLAKLGSQAAATGNRKEAQQLIDEALRRDPNNAEAKLAKSQIQHGATLAMAEEPVGKPAGQSSAPPTAPPAGSGDSGDLHLVAPEPTPPPPGQNPQGAFLNQFNQDRLVRIGQLFAEVNQALESSRQLVAIDPAGVLERMRMKMAEVTNDPELPADVRAKLRDQIEAMITIAKDRRDTKEKDEVDIQKRTAVAQDNLNIMRNLLHTQDKVEQLVQRMNSLLADERWEEAQNDAAAQIAKLDPDSIIAAGSGVNARFQTYYTVYNQTRSLKEKNILAELHLCDTSSIPFPDDVPIIYPSAERWRELTKDREKYKSVDLKEPGSAEAKILKALGDPTEMDFDAVPLKDVIDTLKTRHNIEIQIDVKALTDAGASPDDPITINLKGISLRSALRLMLSAKDLNYYIDHEVLLITSNEVAKNKLVTKVYPVADLVLPVALPSGLNPFQSGAGLGGSGSQNSGMAGGGFGGGGMQGGGFGGGGFGGGGFGGGAFDVPDADATPAKGAAPANPKQPAKITLPGAVPANQAAAHDAKAADAKPSDLGDLDAKWNDFFAKQTVPGLGDADPAVRKRAADQLRQDNAKVRETVKKLVQQQRFAEVAALIRGALRNSWGQPWMYEELGLALQADNQPREEIERALMSAVTFAHTNDDLMLVAAYLSRMGFDARALNLYRQAAQVEPLRFEPYMHGLELANRMGNLEGIQWACVGVLGQSWPSDKAEVVDLARRAAKSTIEQLRASGQGPAADRFQTAMAQAETRDCLVRVSWNGSAEIDMAVEEPSGAVCSQRNPRTASGGALFDASARRASVTDEGTSQDYVVTQGFSGNYRMLLRRVWGKVTAGKVTVDIWTHSGTKQATRIHKQIPLGEKDAMVLFDLKDGRRQEPLAEAQAANAAQAMVGVNQAILAQIIAAPAPVNNPIGNAAAANPALANPAQFNPLLAAQLAAINNPNAAANLAASRANLQGNGTGNGGGNGFGNPPPFGFLPFGFQPAVGYQPVITTLPAGTNMAATAVISADRRYVRISVVPLFSSIGPVEAFNYTTGTETPQSGGSGSSPIGTGP